MKTLLLCLCLSAVTLVPTTDALAQTAQTGRQVYQSACAACHGTDGRGGPDAASDYPLAAPDFTDCNFATREPDADWLAVSHGGGPMRGFSRLMPAFRDALSLAELEPDARIFEIALDRLHAAAKAAVFVGNSMAEDIEGARRAGLRALHLDDDATDVARAPCHCDDPFCRREFARQLRRRQLPLIQSPQTFPPTTPGDPLRFSSRLRSSGLRSRNS